MGGKERGVGGKGKGKWKDGKEGVKRKGEEGKWEMKRMGEYQVVVSWLSFVL